MLRAIENPGCNNVANSYMLGKLNMYRWIEIKTKNSVINTSNSVSLYVFSFVSSLHY